MVCISTTSTNSISFGLSFEAPSDVYRIGRKAALMGRTSSLDFSEFTCQCSNIEDAAEEQRAAEKV
jgi:hypothetical protein